MSRFAALVLIVLGLAFQTSEPTGLQEDLIDREMSAADVPGLAYAVVAGGEIRSTGARGVLRAGSDAEVDADTPFVTGSISKSFTALAVMQLVEAGQVDLDGEISNYLDSFSGQPAASVTIRQLLSHTSGYSTFQGNRSHSDNNAELVDLVHALASVEPAHGPGQRWAYSNANYQILGRLIEVVTAQDYQAYVTANILEPLGMDHSFVADGNVHPSIATGHTPWFGSKRPLGENATHRATAPQGGIIASSNDLALYMQAMMNNEDDVLSARGKATMMQPASALSPQYGFGWYLDSVERSAWHSGSSPGFETLLTLVPEDGSGVVVLVNRGSGMGFGETTQLRKAITAAALNLDYDGEGSRWPQRTVFVSLAFMPVAYLLSVIWAWRHRVPIRRKTNEWPGRFSLWFPLLTTTVSAWILLSLIPKLFHTPLGAIALFQPDLAAAMIATAACGIFWALFRLGVAYTGQLPSAPAGPGSTPGPRAVVTASSGVAVSSGVAASSGSLRLSPQASLAGSNDHSPGR